MCNPLSLEGLIAWLEKQPAETVYDFFEHRECLLYRYLKAVGFAPECVGGLTWTDQNGSSHNIPFVLRRTANSCALGGGWTYGEALARARKLASAGPPADAMTGER